MVALNAIGAVVLILAGLIWSATRGADQRATVEAYAEAWRAGDYPAMWRQTSRDAGDAVQSDQAFAELFQQAAATATALRWNIGTPVDRGDGDWELPVTVRTRAFGLVRGMVPLRVIDEDSTARIAWRANAVFPGLGEGEQLAAETQLPPRATLLARDGTVLAEGPSRTGKAGAPAADIVGSLGPAAPEDAARLRALGFPDNAQVGTSGLERILNDQLSGTPGGTLRAGDRVIGRQAPRQAPPVKSSIDPEVQAAAVTALAGRSGGAVALDPRTGEVLGVSGVGFSGLQPPGSTFKIITVSGALEAGITKPDASFPAESAAVLSGVRLENSFGESCGGTLVVSFAKSCNSVFAPLGAKLGAERLVRTAEAFGFNQAPGLAGAATPTIPQAAALGDDLGVGSAAIGQGAVQATALTMATVAATIADGGRRPRITALAAGDRPAPTTSAVSAATARKVERMMLAVVRPGGTGSSAVITGVPVAGKTGTAELKNTCGPDQDPADGSCAADGDPANTTAWFTSYAPAGPKRRPRAAVAVMLIGAGHGGDTAAPAARSVLVAALKATRP